MMFDPDYDPLTGNLTFLTVYGPSSITFGELQYLINTKIRQSIVFGVCCGASIITFIIMWLVSKRKKTPIFILNQLSLFLLFLQSAFYFKYILSSQSSVTLALTQFPQMVHKYNLHISAAADIFKLLLVVCIECSLVFQVKVMFSGDSFKKISYFLLTASIVIGLTTSGILLTAVVMIIRSIYTGITNKGDIYYNIANILFAGSINFMTLILIIKLILAIRARKFLGLKQFDSFHILLIMTCHSLVVPSILTILAYALQSNEDVLVSVSTLLVVLSLPLSSIWAGSINTASSTRNFKSNPPLTPTGFYPTGIEDLSSPSIVSSPNSGSFPSNIIKRYISRNKQNARSNAREYDNTSGFVETHKEEYKSEKDYSDNIYYGISSDLSFDKLKNEKPEVKKQTIDVFDTKIDTSFTVYTPNTQEDVEARKFWLASDENSDSNILLG